MRVVLLFFSVPPSLRQAAGPLTENLPNVFAGDRCVHRISPAIESPSSRGIQRRLSSRSITAAPWVNKLIGVGIELGITRFEGQRGHLA